MTKQRVPQIYAKEETRVLHEYNNPEIIGVAGRVINDGEVIRKKTSVIAGKSNGLLTKFEKNFWSTKRQAVEFPYGCNMSFRKKALLAVGNFDEKLPTPLSSFEEIDMALRIRKTGTIVFSPKALAYHHRALSGGTRIDLKMRTKLYYQSYGRVVNKHVPFPSSLLSTAIITLRIIKEAPFAIAAFLKGYLL